MFITDKVVFLVFFHLRLFDAIFLQFVFADPSGVLPPPRSACHLFSQSEQGRIIMYAGYSKEQVKKVNMLASSAYQFISSHIQRY